MHRTRSTVLPAPALALAAAALMSAGCYERVVSAHGFGADRMSIQSANSSEPVRTTKLRQEATHKPLPSKYSRER